MNKFLPDIAYITTGKLDSNAAVENGQYPFFTCAPTPSCIDSYAFEEDAVLLAGNNAQGNFHISRYNGKFNAYQRTYVITAKEGYNIDYIGYSIELALAHLKKISQGSQTKFLTKQILDSFPIEDISLNEQNKIAHILKSLDDKIIVNNETISTLESLSKTLYDYYFLQFDFPDEKGRPYKSSGGKMEYNAELGREIPAGWKVGKLTNYVSVIDCLHSKKPDYQYEDEKCYLIQLENLIDSGLIDLSSKYYVTKSDYDKWTSKIEVTEGDILVTNAGRVGGVYRIPSNCKAGIGRNMTALHPTKLPATYLYYYLISKDADQQIRQNTDLGAFFKSLNVKGIKLLKIIKPDEHTLKAFVNRANLTRSRIEACHNENRHLTALRDFLLPLLMNGQVGFKNPTSPNTKEAPHEP